MMLDGRRTLKEFAGYKVEMHLWSQISNGGGPLRKALNDAGIKIVLHFSPMVLSQEGVTQKI